MPKRQTFADFVPVDANALHQARIVVFGASEASPYVVGERSHSADAPLALRQASAQFAGALGQYDFDLGQTMFPEKGDKRGCFDIGDVPTAPWDAEGNRRRITEAVRTILAAGAVPIVLGGDDSVPIPALAGFGDESALTVLQIDAHVDWADAIQGNPYGYGSTMRRASEYAHVTKMIQVGIRGLGSGAAWQHDDARRWGSKLITSYDFHGGGIDTVTDQIEAGSSVFVSIDCDGLDPAVLPAVNMPTPGGLTYEDVIAIIRGVSSKAKIAGLALVEYVPERDDRYGLSGLVASRIACVTAGLALQQLDDQPYGSGGSSRMRRTKEA